MAGIMRIASVLVLVMMLGEVAYGAGQVDGKSSPNGSWYWRNPLPQGNLLFGMAAGNGGVVLVGSSGTILSSEYGLVASGIVEELCGVAFGGGTFVAVGMYGALLTSSDGATWQQHGSTKSGAPSYLGVAYGNGRFVAIASSKVYTSMDGGVTWQSQQLLDPQYYGFSRVVFVNNLFVAVGDGAKVFTSTDGLIWSDRSIPQPIAYSWSHLGVVGYGRGTYVFVTIWGEVFTSPDLTSWVREPYALHASDLIFADDKFVAAGGEDSGSIYSSSDGHVWNELNDPNWFPFTSCAFLDGGFVVAGERGQVLESADAENWTDLTFRVTDLSLKSIAYGNSFFVASSYYPHNLLFSSADGVTWTQLPSVPSSLQVNRIKFVNGAFYLICSDSLLTSADGTAWRTVFSGPNLFFSDLIYANGFYVLVDSNTIRTSRDLTTFTERWTGDTSLFLCVSYGKGTFVAAGGNGLIVTSQDGLTWTKQSMETDDQFQDVSFGNGQFVVVGYYGTIYNSQDGSVWRNRVQGNNSSLASVIHTDDGFVAAGGFDHDLGYGPVWVSLLFTSRDGISWSGGLLSVDGNLSGVTYGMSSYVVVGVSGAILQGSPIFPDPDQASSDPDPSTGGGGGGDGGGCFIATVAFGS